jgi:hypothetical protein
MPQDCCAPAHRHAVHVPVRSPSCRWSHEIAQRRCSLDPVIGGAIDKELTDEPGDRVGIIVDGIDGRAPADEIRVS